MKIPGAPRLFVPQPIGRTFNAVYLGQGHGKAAFSHTQRNTRLRSCSLIRPHAAQGSQTRTIPGISAPVRHHNSIILHYHSLAHTHTPLYLYLHTHIYTGAVFYLDATHPKWSTHYKMYTYLTAELPSLLRSVEGLPLDVIRQSICGHSMGGHGAIALYLRTIIASSGTTDTTDTTTTTTTTTTYRSASAFAPVLNPTNGQWGIKAFNGYLQAGVKEGEKWDSTCLMWEVPEGTPLNVLIDVVSARLRLRLTFTVGGSPWRV